MSNKSSKLVAVLLSVAMLSSMSVSAFAADTTTPAKDPKTTTTAPAKDETKKDEAKPATPAKPADDTKKDEAKPADDAKKDEAKPATDPKKDEAKPATPATPAAPAKPAVPATTTTPAQTAVYDIKIDGTKISFIKNGKVVHTFEATTADFQLKMSKDGKLLVRFINKETGKPLNIDLGAQKTVKIDGNVASLTIEANVAKDIAVTFAATSSVEKLTVYAPVKVAFEKDAKYGEVKAVKGATVEGIDAKDVKTTVAPAKTTTNTGTANVSGGKTGGGGGGGGHTSGSNTMPSTDVAGPVARGLTFDGKTDENVDRTIYPDAAKLSKVTNLVLALDENAYLVGDAATAVVNYTTTTVTKPEKFGTFTVAGNKLTIIIDAEVAKTGIEDGATTFIIPAGVLKDIKGNVNKEITIATNFEKGAIVKTAAGLDTAVAAEATAVPLIYIAEGFDIATTVTLADNQSLEVAPGVTVAITKDGSLVAEQGKGKVNVFGTASIAAGGKLTLGTDVWVGENGALTHTGGPIELSTNAKGAFTLTVPAKTELTVAKDLTIGTNDVVAVDGKLIVATGKTLKVNGTINVDAAGTVTGAANDSKLVVSGDKVMLGLDGKTADKALAADTYTWNGSDAWAIAQP
ncbi:MAG: hypothetical protein RRZ73_01230 [Oscillospiraceae bacterium]